MLTRRQTEQLVAAIVRRGDSPNTKRNYATDLRRFFGWLEAEGIAPHEASADDLDRYRAWLIEPDEAGAPRYSVASANRALTVVRLFYAEAQRRGWLWISPAAWLRSIRGGGDSGQPALTLGQVRELLGQMEEAADDDAGHNRLSALRDRVALHLLIRNGLRREELAGVRVADLGHDQGHAVLTVTAGKGRKRRRVKVQPDTLRGIQAWITAAELEPTEPLLIQVAKGGRLVRKALSGEAVREIVRRRLTLIGIEDPRYGAHGMRATFATLALAGGAPIQKVARAMGHAKTDTTATYDRRRDDLDDNASDYLRL